MGTHPIFESDFDCLTEIMLYAIVPDASYLSGKSGQLKIDNVQVSVELASTDGHEVMAQFIRQCHAESVVITSTPQLDDELLQTLIQSFINSTGGTVNESLFSARELNEEPKCLLSGDFLCSEVIARSSIEVIEYFKQATRTRESLGINVPALLSLHRNGKTLNFVINPPSCSGVKNLNIYPRAFLLLLTSSPSDVELLKLAKFIQSRDETKRITSRHIRQNLHELNRDMSRQTAPDETKRNQLMGLIKQLNCLPDEENRIDKAQCFMAKREERLQQNGLLWSVQEEQRDMERKLSMQYQQLRHNLESARAQLASVKAASSDRFEVNRELILVREAESRLSACEAQIAANSVISLHHQLKAERDVTRREQLEELKKAQSSNKPQPELLIIHVEAQKRMIEQLERDAETVIQHHQHFVDQLKVKQLAVMQQYRQLMESSAADRQQRLESLLHESMTDALL